MEVEGDGGFAIEGVVDGVMGDGRGLGAAVGAVMARDELGVYGCDFVGVADLGPSHSLEVVAIFARVDCDGLGVAIAAEGEELADVIDGTEGGPAGLAGREELATDDVAGRRRAIGLGDEALALAKDARDGWREGGEGSDGEVFYVL